MAVYLLISLLLLPLVQLCSAQNNSSVDSKISPASSAVDDFSEGLLMPSLSIYIVDATHVSSSATAAASGTSSSRLIPLTSSSVVEPSFSLSPTPAAVTLASSNLTDQFSTTTSCSCNFAVQSCDTDCCCDPDCTSTDIASFSQCLDQQNDSFTRQCLPSTALFRTSLLGTRGSNLFCVYFDNYPGRTMFPDTSIATTLTDLTNQLTLYSRTGDLATPVYYFNPTTTSSIYRSGDVVNVVFSSDTVGYLSLPTSLNGDICHDGNPVTYLTDQSTKCTRYIGSPSIDSSLNALNYYENISLPALPRNRNSSLVSIELGTVRCLNLIGQPVSCDGRLSPTFNTSTFDNVLLALDYIIFHNGSEGIVRALADVTLGQIEAVNSVSQQFSVRFISISGVSVDAVNYMSLTEEINLRRSGSPGYIDGEPILAGVLSAGAVSVSVNSMDWLTLLRGGTRGVCGNQRESVTFRDNMKTSCVLSLSSSVIASGCTGVGSQTLSLLLGNSVDRIAIYGNSDPRDLSQWIQIFGLSDIPTTFECSSVVTGIQITLLYSYSGQVDSPQAFITGARIQYITQDLTNLCASSQCSITSVMTLSLHSSVTFIPAYSVPAQVLKTTTFTARTLPEDFLYPLLSTSGAAEMTTSWILVTLILIVSCQLSLANY